MDLSSFSELLRRQAPELLPVNRQAVAPSDALPHGTTIVALKYPGGVVMAGDRRSTQGNMIAGRDVQKVYITDDYTVTGIAGTAAIAVEFARLYAVELEHYEKLEGVALTFAGKVNRLATMVRGNLGAALQGFVALPLLAGYDLDDPNPQAAGRIVSFDAAGGWNFEDEGYQSVGSGSIFAKSSMKKLYSQVADADSALRVAVEALYDAADDDSRQVARIWCAASIRPRWSSGPTARRRFPSNALRTSRGRSSKAVPGQTLSVRMSRIGPPTRGETRELSIFHLARTGDARAFGARAQGHRPR